MKSVEDLIRGTTFVENTVQLTLFSFHGLPKHVKHTHIHTHTSDRYGGGGDSLVPIETKSHWLREREKGGGRGNR